MVEGQHKNPALKATCTIEIDADLGVAERLKKNSITDSDTKNRQLTVRVERGWWSG